jgi:hypothetical protein
VEAENGLDPCQENSVAKNYSAHMLRHVVDTARQLPARLANPHDLALAASLWRGSTNGLSIGRTRCTAGTTCVDSRHPNVKDLHKTVRGEGGGTNAESVV